MRDKGGSMQEEEDIGVKSGGRGRGTVAPPARVFFLGRDSTKKASSRAIVIIFSGRLKLENSQSKF